MSPGLLQDNGLQLVLIDHGRHGFVRFRSSHRVDQVVDWSIQVNAQVETSPRGKASVRIEPGLNRFGCFGVPEMGPLDSIPFSAWAQIRQNHAKQDDWREDDCGSRSCEALQ